jgi:colanic acid/amylovoran biosynthesis protein
MNNLAEIGVRAEKARITADAAFALADPATLTAASKWKGAIRRVAVSVRHWTKFKAKSVAKGVRDYRRSVGNAVEWLVTSLGVEIVFISTCQGISEYWSDDSAIAEDIVANLAPEVKPFVSVDHAFHSPEQLLILLRDFDLVIATRMHMAILALASGVPVLPIAYEFKTEELFINEFGMSDWVFPMEDLTEVSISRSLPKFLERLPELRPVIFGAVERLRKDALGIAAELRRLREP